VFELEIALVCLNVDNSGTNVEQKVAQK
jgi:hypothetical protein